MELVKAAEDYQRKHFKNSCESVKYVNYFINDKSCNDIKDLTKKFFPDSSENVAIIGLHACADLSVTILDLFTMIESARRLIIVPCCYHRLKLLSSTKCEESFENFPASYMLKKLFKHVDGQKFLKTTFLRLACQQSGALIKRASNRILKDHAKHCLLRAVLEKVASEGLRFF